MEAILASKLECSGVQQEGMPVTPLSFLRVMSAVSRAAAARLEVISLPFSPCHDIVAEMLISR